MCSSPRRSGSGIPVGTIKVTVLIETLPAVFEMDEILYELREHIAGLNCGRWDYIFSFIKTLRAKPEYLLPDRGQVVMSKAFLNAYAELADQDLPPARRLRHGRHGGLHPQSPRSGSDGEGARRRARGQAARGADTVMTAPGWRIPIWCRWRWRFSTSTCRRKNQLGKLREDVEGGQKELLQVHEGTRSEEGLRVNIRVGVQYIEAWLRGNGAVPLYNLMEDAATAEISRTQVWQWVKYGATLADGRTVTRALFEAALADEMAKLKTALGDAYAKGRFDEAIGLFKQLVLSDKLEAFLTLPAYKLIA